jgi:hypothetical protein
MEVLMVLQKLRKALLTSAVVYLLTVLTLGYFGYPLSTSKFAQMASLFLAIGVFISTVKPADKYCTWCRSENIEFTEGKKGRFYWEYRNKDGSRDKRVKDNVQKANYTSQYKCRECGAISKFVHFVNEKPSRNINVSRGSLVSAGSGERTGADFYRGGKEVRTTGENRKGKN